MLPLPMEGMWVRQRCDGYVILVPSITSVGVVGTVLGRVQVGVDPGFSCLCLGGCCIPRLICRCAMWGIFFFNGA